MPEAIDRETNKPFIGKTLNVSLNQLQAALVKLFKPDGDYIPETALFYFSGHGVRQNLGIAEGFLATSDVYPELNFNPFLDSTRIHVDLSDRVSNGI